MSILEAAQLPLAREPWRSVVADAGFVAAVMAVAIGLAAVADLPLGAAGLVVALITAGILWRFHSRGAARRFGLANWVTLLRLVLVTLLLLAVWLGAPGMLPSWELFGVALVALVLDGVDGWLARRRQETSTFGERFDMGADTVFTITLTLCLAAFALVGPWVLVIGLLRPAFAAGGRVWPVLGSPLRESRGRKVVCAASLGCLVAGLAPPLAAFAPALALAALALLLWSFGRDLRDLLRRAEAV